MPERSKPERSADAMRRESSLADIQISDALDSLGAKTREAMPAADLCERLLARAEGLGLLSEKGAALGGRSRTRSPRRWWGNPPALGLRIPRWALASLAAAMAFALVWMATSAWEWPLTGPTPEVKVVSQDGGIQAPPGNEALGEHNTHESAQHSPGKQKAGTAANATAPMVAAVKPKPGQATRSNRRTLASARTPEAAASVATSSAPTDLASAATPQEAASARYSEFVPMGVGTQLRPDEFVQAVRVRIGANEFWRLGLPVTPNGGNELVTADFLVGEDGRPRAVRLVSDME